MLIEQLGLEGYGIYWILIETLRDQPNHRYPLNLLPALARRYLTSTEKVETVVRNYDLFRVENNEIFLSPSLCRRMEAINARRKQLSEAGKKGRLKQLQSTTDRTRTSPGLSPDTPQASKEKIRKEKERKGNELNSVFGVFENVFLSITEKTKLDDKFGSKVSDKIDALSEYMQSTGKVYKSHYATILNWERRERKSKTNRGMGNSVFGTSNSTEKALL
jgi:hypothetical protein